MKNSILAIILIISIFINQAQSKDIYVAPNGNDNNLGTIDKPLKTLETAKTLARKQKDSVIVWVRGGTYELIKPLKFTHLDTRRKEAPLVFRTYNQEKVVISGVQTHKLKWTTFKDGIYQANVEQNVLFDQIFVGNKKYRMARYPNYDSTSSHFGGFAENLFDKAVTEKWHNPTGAFIHALHKHEWGGYHYQVTGKNSDGTLKLIGGYQNNRQMGMHNKYRFIENIFEELDDPGEWFYDQSKKILYVIPYSGQELNNETILSPHLSSLIEFKASASKPVTNITFDGFDFEHVTRTFMATKEPLLRSDWTIYRGGAIVLEGTENCKITNSTFNEIGGNGVFFNNYNRNSEISNSVFNKIGASAICFVGDPNAVRSPSFEYNNFIDYKNLDLLPGPIGTNFPSECMAYNNLIHDIGQTEKQVAGVEISMAMDITVRHNTIYNTPRSGINISEGTWGGHIIEYNDVFNTVLETGDHGSFNSWGRDRFWQPNRAKMDSLVAAHPEIIMLDVVKPITIRNNRFRCDHGWDIDLDDGSSNYFIYNNLCLNGGIKLREGFRRTVVNNIMINNSFHPHVWFSNSGDMFKFNIVTKRYFPIQISKWGKEVDYNFFPTQESLLAAQKNGTDQHSKYGNAGFIEPQSGNFQVANNSEALQLGFKNFSMDEFGVVSNNLKSLAQKIDIPVLQNALDQKNLETITWLGADLKNISGLGDRSAYGLPDETGILIKHIKKNSIIGKSSLQPNDVIRSINSKVVTNIQEFMNVIQEINWTGQADLMVIRNQKTEKIHIELK